jgi:hypothetical protein
MNDSIKDDEANVQSRDTEPWQSQFQFPLYKLFLVMAVYAISFAAYGSSETWQIGIAVWVGTAWSGWILAVRTRKDLLNTAIVVAGSVVGIIFAEMLTPPHTGFINGLATLIVSVVGGAALFAGSARITVKREDIS